jgi:hypothetical protein
MMIGPDQRFLWRQVRMRAGRFSRAWEGSRLLPTDRPNTLQSDSPPKGGSGLHQVFAGNSLGVTRKSNVSVPRITDNTDRWPISLPTKSR